MSRSKVTRFGEKLKNLRTSRGLTLKEVAHALGYGTSVGYISELEAGKKIPTVEFVVGVALFFGVTTDILIMDELNLSGPDQKKVS